jgi:hypothetical protein
VAIRFVVANVWDLSSRSGLLASGWVIGGPIEPGAVLRGDYGATTRVLGLELQSPADRRTGQLTYVLERTDPSPVVADATLTVVSRMADPPTYEYLVLFQSEEQTALPVTVLVSEVTLGPPRAINYHQSQRRWTFNPALGARLLFDDEILDQTRRVSRAEAEEVCQSLGTTLPTDPELRNLMRTGAAAADAQDGRPCLILPGKMAAAFVAGTRGDLNALHGCVDWPLSAAPTIAAALAGFDLSLGYAALAELAAQLERDAADPGSTDLAPLAAALASYRTVARADARTTRDTLHELLVPPVAADAPDDVLEYYTTLAERSTSLVDVFVIETTDRLLPVAMTPAGRLVLPLSTRVYEFGRPAAAPLTDTADAPDVLVHLVKAAKFRGPLGVARLIDWPLSGAAGIAAAVLASDRAERWSGPARGLAELAAATDRPDLALPVVAELEDGLAGATGIVRAEPEEQRAALDALRVPPLPADAPAELAATFDRLRSRADRLTVVWAVVGPGSRQTYAVAPDSGLAVTRIE